MAELSCPRLQGPETAQDEAPKPSTTDDWELDPSDIVFQEKIASGAFGDLYKGVYCGQEVAIKILRNIQDNSTQHQEFLQVSWGHTLLLRFCQC